MSIYALQNYTPCSVSGCQLWLDGSDPAGTGSAPANGQLLAKWTDKSPGHHDAIPIMGSPTFSINRVVMDGSSYMDTSLHVEGSRMATYFVVFTNTDSSRNTAILSGSVDPPTFAIIQSPTMTGGAGISASELITWGAINNTAYVSTPYLVTATTSNLTYTCGVNGGTPTSALVTVSSTPAVLRLAATYEAVGWYLNGSLYEVVVYDSVLSPTDRQKVEGYLAWKWSLANTLPPLHPYKTFPPSHYANPSVGTALAPSIRCIPAALYPSPRPIVNPTITYTTQSVISYTTPSTWTPSSVSGLILWLDGQDPANGTRPSAGTLNTWVDKSIQGNNVTKLAGVYVAPTYNGSNGVVFNQNYLTRDSSSFTGIDINKTLSIFVAANATSIRSGWIDDTWGMVMSFRGTADGYLIGPAGKGDVPNPYRHQITCIANSSYPFTCTTKNYSSLSVNFLYSIVNTYQGSTGNYICTVRDKGVKFTTNNDTLFTWTATAANVVHFRLGGWFGRNDYFDAFYGTIYEVLMYSGDMTDADRQTIETYLSKKYSL